ncbi:uncharacterized protein EV422DRAFT_576169 [Fimicolochytrium jonesii]|uniref:uncharacterized protein n=1 Tax=Fimicolochytrium jonesii TaxID=1396493 RepID=UPI0022FDD520|nr:uncharacterized protein EV422DRAFT_576169 [Fimicolochytrium jonesii]KAI8824924.1 hypothetical protein EV422DRAFT_576169 [Fimicolochytrium jonesii]
MAADKLSQSESTTPLTLTVHDTDPQPWDRSASARTLDGSIDEDSRVIDVDLHPDGKASTAYEVNLKHHDDDDEKLKAAGKEEKPRTRTIVLSVSFYMFASTALLLANKMVLLKVALPITFLWIQLVIAVALMHVGEAMRLFPLPRIDWNVCVRLWPMILINVLGLSVNTYTIQYGDASFYQVARGLVLPFTVLLSALYLTRPSPSILACCLIVTIGYFTGTAFSPTSTTGTKPVKAIAFGLISCVSTAVHAIVIKKSIAVVDGDTLALVYFNNALSAVLLPVVFLVTGEVSRWGTLGAIEGEDGAGVGVFVAGCLLTGFLGFLLNVASFFQINVTSPVTHVVSSAARGVLQIVLAAWLFNETVTSSRGWSIAIIIVGSGMYTWVKHRESLAGR